ncbi:MAG: hypothetical protein J6Q68_04645 [Clostridia bacterium]|nr:hypothetical protein [Clostridia bacterium]
MKYINQLEYAHIPYPTRVKQEEYAPNGMNSTVRSSGCGLCSVCMAIDLITDTTLDIEECVRISCECVANHSRGTDMNILGPVIAEKFNVEYTKTSDLDEAIKHLQTGGVIVVHVGVPEGKEIGLFTKGGHYMLLISTDGNEFCILDPSYSTEKFKMPEREGRVNEENAPYLYCDVNVLDSETKLGRVKYHMFARKKK